MGRIANALGLRAQAPLRVVAPPPERTERATASRSLRVGIKSPWQGPGDLSPVVWREWLEASSSFLPVSRADVLSVPSAARAVGQVSSALMECPWVQYVGDEPTDPQPRWLYATNGEVAPQYRTQMVAEDLVIDGWSLLDVSRDGSNRVTAVDHRPASQWRFDDEGNVCDVDDDATQLDPATYVLVKGPTPGLRAAVRTIRGAIALEDAWTKAVRVPAPTTLITQEVDDTLEDGESDELLEDWRTARQDPDGTVAFIPYGFAVSFPGETQTELLVAARNAVAVDIARLAGLPAAAVDAGSVQQSLTYVNTALGVGLQLVQQGVRPYATAIGAALSLDNVTPSGSRIGLDMSQLLADAATLSPSGPATKD